MVISRKCENNGCHNDTFMLEMYKEKLFIKCSNCGNEQYEGELNNWRPLPDCKCGCINFKVSFDEDDNSLDISCARCGQGPIDGIKVEQKEVQSMSPTRRYMYDLNKKLDVLLKGQAEMKDALDETYISSEISGAKLESEDFQFINKTKRLMHEINKKLDVLIEEQVALKDNLIDKLDEMNWKIKHNEDDDED